MIKIIEAGRIVGKDIESRITKDENGFYRHETRVLPVESWEPLDGWRVDYISNIPLTNNKPYPYH